MARDGPADRGVQGQIDDALRSRRFLPPLPACLAEDYEAAQDVGRRRLNWYAMGSFLAIFDLFLAAQFRSAPELVPLSALLRLAVLTPCFVLFIVLDRRQRLGRLYEPLLLLLALMPIVISAVLCVRTTSTTSLSDIRATPMILMSTGLIWRLRLWSSLANSLVSCFLLIGSVVIAPCVPQAELGSLILVDLGFATTAMMFAVQMERRDRHVFMLQAKERLRGEALLASNIGLRQDAQTDPLTGVANRRCFDETLDTLWREAMRRREPIGLIMIDVDHFKAFNDHYGHQGGDECLRLIAARGRDQMRPGDLFARYGGEEFAVLVPRARIDEVAHVAGRIHAAVRALGMPHHGVGPAATVSVSLGVASIVPVDDSGARLLLEAADCHLYAAKRAGRNRVHAGEAETAPRVEAGTLLPHPG